MLTIFGEVFRGILSKIEIMKIFKKVSFLFYFLFSNFLFKTKVVKGVSDKLDEVFRLRGNIFGKKLGWIKTDDNGKDVDKYDKISIHFIVSSRLTNKILIYCRVIKAENKFMLEKDFSPILCGKKLKKERRSVEITRLTLREKYIKTSKGKALQVFLYNKMYEWSKDNKVKYWYFVVREEFFKKLQFFGLKGVGKKYYFQKNVPTMAGVLNIDKAFGKIKEEGWIKYFFNLKKHGARL